MSALPNPPSRFDGFLHELEDRPYRFDLFNTLRHIDALNPRDPKIGKANLPIYETLRFGQEPSLSFAPTTLASYQRKPGKKRCLKVYSFGLFGPNGPLPLHLTEYARERLYQAHDATFTDFADMFHHRLISLFYRAWANAQPTVSLDRPDDDRFSAYVSSLVNLGQPTLTERDTVPHHAKLYNLAHLVRPSRNPEGLRHALSNFFQAPVSLAEYSGHWLKLPPDQLTVLGRKADNNQLGVSAIVGTSVWDRQSKFRLRIGPVSLAAYRAFLPGQQNHQVLVDWVRNYIGFEFEWDVVLVLRKDEVPQARIGGDQQLGWTTWLGDYRRPADADDLCINPEKRLAAKNKHK